MARSFTCDGCGGNIAEPQQLGFILKRDYCPACAKNAEAFLAAEEEQRARFYERFAENRKQLIAVHSKDGSFKLPDVP
jgi:hypothetical protein